MTMEHRSQRGAITVFTLFFGLAFIESVVARNWGLVTLFGALGALSVFGDIGARRRNRGPRRW
jgi:hypothetical protein